MRRVVLSDNGRLSDAPALPDGMADDPADSLFDRLVDYCERGISRL
jgi:hypothetical protein